MDEHVPTSAVLDGLLREAPSGAVTIDWIMDGLRERSFGIVILILGLLALVPGLSTVAGILLVWPAIQMILARHSPGLPRRIAAWPLPAQKVSRLIARAVPVLRRIETLIRPRWPTPFESTKRVVGAVIMLLGLTLVGPIPFSHVIPALAIMLVALAYLEKDGVMLAIGLFVALVSLAISAAAVWGTVAGIEFLDRRL
jgi:hypothetical protein